MAEEIIYSVIKMSCNNDPSLEVAILHDTQITLINNNNRG
jgi:hypothetical protein